MTNDHEIYAPTLPTRHGERHWLTTRTDIAWLAMAAVLLVLLMTDSIWMIQRASLFAAAEVWACGMFILGCCLWSNVSRLSDNRPAVGGPAALSGLVIGASAPGVFAMHTSWSVPLVIGIVAAGGVGGLCGFGLTRLVGQSAR